MNSYNNYKQLLITVHKYRKMFIKWIIPLQFLSQINMDG